MAGDKAARVRRTPFAVDAQCRRAGARHWLQTATIEHARVAAFARLAIDLLALRAPDALVARCHRAALEELEHARRALAVAAAIDGRRRDLGGIPAAMVREPSPAVVAVDAFVDGCIGEAAAAVCAQRAAEYAEEPIAGVLREIASVEIEHATLAWAVVDWAVAGDDAVATALREALREHLDALGRRESGAPGVLALGVLPASAAVALERDLIEQVVGPVLESVIAKGRAQARAGAVV